MPDDMKEKFLKMVATKVKPPPKVTMDELDSVLTSDTNKKSDENKQKMI